MRISGRDRYQTSIEIARHLDSSQSVFIATGTNFPDALSIASYAAANEIPIILSRPGGLGALSIPQAFTTLIQITAMKLFL